MGLLDGGIDPNTLGLLGALSGFSSGMAPALGYSRLPQSTAQAVAGGVGGMTNGLLTGILAGQQNRLTNQEIQQRQFANAMMMAKFHDIASRHPEWFGGILPGGGAPPRGPGASAGSPLLAQASPQTATSGGSGLLGDPSQPQGAGPTSLLGGPAGAANVGPPLAPGTMGSGPGASPGGPGGAGGGAPFANMQDAQDYLWLHPEMKDIVSKQFPGPTPYQQAISYANSLPDGPEKTQALRAAAKAAGIDTTVNSRQGSETEVWNPATNKYDVVSRNPVLGSGVTLDDNGNAQTVPNYIGAATPVHQMEAQAQQQAQLAREQAMGRFNYGLEYGAPPPGSNGALPPPASSLTPPPLSDMVGASQQPGPTVARAAAQGTAPAIPPIVQIPGAGGVPGSTSTAPGLKPVANGFETQAGTVIPPISQAAPINPAGKNLDQRFKDWNDVENKWGESVKPGLIAEQRALAIANAFKQTESGAFAEEKANIKAGLKSAGIDLPDSVFGSPAQVQIALKDNFNTVLEQIKAFSSRPAAAELTLAQKNFSNPNLQPEANQAIIGQVVGNIRWDRQMLNDYAQAKALGWKDPTDFQRAWAQQPQNSLQGFIDSAQQQIGPLKGMPGGPGSPAPKPIDATTMNAAQNAIMRGAPKAAVLKRLQDNGYDVSKF